MSLKTDVLPILPRLLLVLGMLAGVAILTVQGSITANDAYGILGFIIGATAVAGTIVLSDAGQPNTNLLPHLVILLAIIGFTVAMGVRDIFTGTEIVGVFTVLLGGGGYALGSAAPSSSTTTTGTTGTAAITAQAAPVTDLPPVAAALIDPTTTSAP